jgi:hypothetical protein
MSFYPTYNTFSTKFKHHHKLKNLENTNSSVISSTNFSYNFNPSNLDDIKQVQSIIKENTKIRGGFQKIRKLKQKILSTTHRDSMREELEKKRVNIDSFRLAPIEHREEQISSPQKNNSHRLTFSIMSPDKSLYKELNEQTIKTDKFLKGISFFPQDGIDKFLTKLKEMRSLHLINEIQNEKKISSDETYWNKLDKVNEEMMTNRKNETLLTEWDSKFSHYMKLLKIQREQEKVDLESLLYSKNKLEAEVKILSSKINKMKKMIEDYIIKRNFFICVKEKIKSLPSSFYFFAQEYEEEYLKTEIFLTTGSSNKSRRTAKKFVTPSEFDIPESDRNQLNKLLKYVKTNRVFNSVSEFNSHMENLEKENMDLLIEYENNNTKCVRIRLENQNLLKSIKHNENSLFHKIKSHEKTLINLKKKNSMMKAELEKLKINSGLAKVNSNSCSDHIVNNNFETNKTISEVYYRSLNIVNELKSKLPVLIFSEYSKYTRGEISHLKTIQCLIDLEKGVNFLLERYKIYTQLSNKKNSGYEPDIAKSLANIESIMEKDRIRQKGEELKIKNILKREILSREVNKRANKLIILPKRKVGFRFRPKTSNKKNNSITRKDSEEEFLEFFSNNEI